MLSTSCLFNFWYLAQDFVKFFPYLVNFFFPFLVVLKMKKFNSSLSNDLGYIFALSEFISSSCCTSLSTEYDAVPINATNGGMYYLFRYCFDIPSDVEICRSKSCPSRYAMCFVNYDKWYGSFVCHCGEFPSEAFYLQSFGI